MNNSNSEKKTVKWIATHLPIIYAVLAAVSLSSLMSLYDGQPVVKTVTGALACGVMTAVLATSLDFFGLPITSATLVGASVGFMGAEKIRDKITSFVDSRNRRVKSGE
ncbi:MULTISPECIES: phage holin family protein [Enterobacteriaceae]|uniref:phage holin family protein n=1 Tax=Enterobacteriaceae TaxID=543 RepID=UPI00034EE7BC|nr:MULTISPECIES: phage holin family protein [Enterobacteriaceae]AGN86513.1 hypothetical protein H650_15665 [Enterobacter sp. R4-368]QHM96972.1 holin [Kosakonia sacchari]RCW95880.1 lambda family phage holin [Kosakonia sp. AG348]